MLYTSRWWNVACNVSLRLHLIDYGLRDYGTADQIGLEPTPDEYVAKLVQVFREVKRVLKDDGVLWLNLGDSYTAGGSNRNGMDSKNWADYFGGDDSKRAHKNTKRIAEIDKGCKPKDLIGIPWMVAFALRADGWYLRSDIIWAKPNPMPESVKDRPTKAHEYVFLLAKSQKYYYDNEAVQEPTQAKVIETRMREEKREVYNAKYKNSGVKRTMTRNSRSVWTVNTQPFKGAHFAVMPEKLVEPCILAGTSEYGQCPNCGANWVRVVERTNESSWQERKNNGGATGGSMIEGNTQQTGKYRKGNCADLPAFECVTKCWQPTCNCNAGREPNIVLDPFAGSGTVGVVAQKHGRQFIGIELNPDYVKLAEARLIATPQSLFNQSVLQETP